jgi:protein gp37
MSKTKIEWATDVWNPVTGCSKKSDGCFNCYAERMAKRLAGSYGYPADEPFRVTLHEDRLEQPLSWMRPRRIFVCSMGDLFHQNVPDSYISTVFAVMSLTPQHTYLVLTKRAERMKAYLDEMTKDPEAYCYAWRDTLDLELFKHRNLQPLRTWPLPNVWLGVSVENQSAADERIPLLVTTPAVIHFVSCEPLLGKVDLAIEGWNYGIDYETWSERIKWVIAGGETGPNARPTNPDWVRSLRDQCKRSDTPFFFKRWGDKLWGMDKPSTLDSYQRRLLDGEIWDQYPKMDE